MLVKGYYQTGETNVDAIRKAAYASTGSTSLRTLSSARTGSPSAT